MFPSPRTECASVEQTIFTPAASASRTWPADEVEPVRQAVHLQRDARLERDLEDPLQVERVLGPVVEDPPLRVREARRSRMAHRLDDPVGERRAAPALAGVEADLHPLELGEHVVGEVERAVREDVALAAAQDPERREQLVRGGDLLALPADVVRVEPGDDPHVARVVADREVLVAESLGGAAHLLDGRLAVRGRRVRVQLAADVAELEQVGRRRRRVELAQLRRRQLARGQILGALRPTPASRSRGRGLVPSSPASRRRPRSGSPPR